MTQVKYIANPIRSRALAVILPIIFGPLGVLYSTVIGALILLVLTLICMGAKSLHALALIWIIGPFVSVIITNQYNKKWLNKETQHGSDDQAPLD